MQRRRVAGSQPTHLQQAAAPVRPRLAGRRSHMDPHALQGAAPSQSAALGGLYSGQGRGRAFRRVRSVTCLWIFPEVVVARRGCAGGLPAFALFLWALVAVHRTGGLLDFSFHRLRSGLESKCRHNRLLNKNLEISRARSAQCSTLAPIRICARLRALCAPAQIAIAMPHNSRDCTELCRRSGDRLDCGAVKCRWRRRLTDGDVSAAYCPGPSGAEQCRPGCI